MGIFEKFESMNSSQQSDIISDVTIVTKSPNHTLTSCNDRENHGDKTRLKSVTNQVTNIVTISSFDEHDANWNQERPTHECNEKGVKLYRNSYKKTGFRQEAFQKAFAWINSHLPDLLEAGWTRPELFRRGKYKWPLGLWGVAWLSIWSTPHLTVTIGRHGEIVFQVTRQNRSFTQAAWPTKPKNPPTY